MRWAARRRRTGRRQRAQGFTLIEVGLVVGVLALLAVLVSDFYVAQLNLRYAKERADGAVRDMRQIMDAALAWRDGNPNDFWPNDANRIAIGQLATDGYLPRIPPNRYTGCSGPAACGQYTLLGWDRDAATSARACASAGVGPYTDDFMDAEDLVLRVNVWGADAHGIAAQLPLGEAFLVSGTSRRYCVEARLTYDGTSDRFVHLRNEGRALAFGRVQDPDEPLLPLGDLRGVARIAWQRDVPVDGEGNELDLYQRDGDGNYDRWRPPGRPAPGLPIVAPPQGPDPDDTGTGITLDEENVTVHGDLWIRTLDERDQTPNRLNVGSRIVAAEGAIDQLITDFCTLPGASGPSC